MPSPVGELIDMTDQAKAVAKLPALRKKCAARTLHFRRRSLSFTVIGWQSQRFRQKFETPAVTGVLESILATWQSVAKWGLRESNPRPVLT